MTPHKHADVLHALAEGREVEYRCSPHSDWETLGNPETGADPFYYPDWDWRVKPVPVIRYEYLLWNEARNAYNKWDVGVSHWDIKITFEDNVAIKVESKS
jgi:hypothetical protein